MSKKSYERFVDRFFDEENFDDVKIEDNNGKEIEFEQVAVVDYEEHYYAILRPITPLEGVAEDEALVFLIDEEKDELVYVEDEAVAEKVFETLYSEDEE